jgi:chaperonin GroES
MLPIRPNYQFYLDALNNWYVPLIDWVRLTDWASDYSGGSYSPYQSQLPAGYAEWLKQQLVFFINNPNLDTIPDFFDMKPANDNVVLKQLPADDKTAGGIIIPPSAKETSLLGEVLHVGPGRYNAETGKPDPMTAKVGDKVLFDKFAGTPLVLAGENCIIMAERFILIYL